jgi:uncharacterized protein YhjY with autotransporter beta-barrel domain
VPYALLQVDSNFSVDVSAGYSDLETDMKRVDGQDLNTITGSTDSTRWFAATNLNGNWSMDKFLAGATVGLFTVREDKEAFNESGALVTGVAFAGGLAVAGQTTDLGRAHIGGDLGYDLGMMVPYVSADYRADYDTESSDNDSIALSIGSRFQLGDAVSASIEANTVQSKDDLDQWGALASFRVNF